MRQDYRPSDPRWGRDRLADARTIAALGWLPAEEALESLKESWIDQWSRHLVTTNYSNRIARRKRRDA